MRAPKCKACGEEHWGLCAWKRKASAGNPTPEPANNQKPSVTATPNLIITQDVTPHASDKAKRAAYMKAYRAKSKRQLIDTPVKTRARPIRPSRLARNSAQS